MLVPVEPTGGGGGVGGGGGGGGGDGEPREMWLRVSPEQATRVQPGMRVSATVAADGSLGGDDDDPAEYDETPRDGLILTPTGASEQQRVAGSRTTGPFRAKRNAASGELGGGGGARGDDGTARSRGAARGGGATGGALAPGARGRGGAPLLAFDTLQTGMRLEGRMVGGDDDSSTTVRARGLGDLLSLGVCLAPTHTAPPPSYGKEVLSRSVQGRDNANLSAQHATRITCRDKP